MKNKDPEAWKARQICEKILPKKTIEVNDENFGFGSYSNQSSQQTSPTPSPKKQEKSTSNSNKSYGSQNEFSS